ncbi:hypothetical protein INTERNEXUS_268 [Bacillus phage vB_BspM_Internexus]|nr:hypothetical protein INTERNEXUS_268 [Bacillus phage vB_BspM_Internexus]
MLIQPVSPIIPIYNNNLKDKFLKNKKNEKQKNDLIFKDILEKYIKKGVLL